MVFGLNVVVATLVLVVETVLAGVEPATGMDHFLELQAVYLRTRLDFGNHYSEDTLIHTYVAEEGA